MRAIMGKRVKITYTSRGTVEATVSGVLSRIETGYGTYFVIDDKIYISEIYIVKIEVQE